MQNNESSSVEGANERIGALLRWAARGGGSAWKARAVLAVAGVYLVGIFALLLTLIWPVVF